MSWRSRWVVLVPGDASWVERRTRELLDEEGYGDEIRFVVMPGRGHYQAVVQEGGHGHEPEILLATHFSLERGDAVYAIAGNEDFPSISRFLRGEEEDVKEQEPEELVRSLGCVLPWSEEPPGKPLKRQARRVVLIQGLSEPQVRDALVKQAICPLSDGFYRLEEVPRGLLLTDGKGALTVEDVALSKRFPLATMYSVVATPSLDFFVVSVRHKRKTRQFSWPPAESPLFPALHDVMGERTPERILAALGIPQEWFRL